MCPRCFSKFKRSDVSKIENCVLDIIQFIYKGYSTETSLISELKLDDDTVLLGLPTNDKELNKQFLYDVRNSIYYQIGDYLAAVQNAFESFKTFLETLDSSLMQTKEEKKVLSYVLISKNELFTFSSLPTFGVVVSDHDFFLFDNAKWEEESKSYYSKFNLSRIQQQMNKVKIVFGLSIKKFEKYPLLSQTTEFKDEDEKRLFIEQLHNKTFDHLEEHYKKYDGIIFDNVAPSGFVLSLAL